MAEPADLRPATPEDLAEALAYALRYRGRTRVRDSGEITACIVAERLVEQSRAIGLRRHETAAGHGHRGARARA
jgi:hypothetical protein